MHLVHVPCAVLADAGSGHLTHEYPKIPGAMHKL